MKVVNKHTKDRGLPQRLHELLLKIIFCLKTLVERAIISYFANFMVIRGIEEDIC